MIDMQAKPLAGWYGADPFEPSFRDNPYPALSALRETHRVNLTPVNTYRISRYDDVVEIFQKANTSMTLANGESPNFHPREERGSFREFMLNLDGDVHDRLRALVFKSFNPRTIKRLEAEVKEVVDESIDECLADGQLEVISGLARRVPSQIICRVMGIPDADRELFTRWTELRTNAFFARFLPDSVVEALIAAGNEMADYFDALVAARRTDLREDLVSELIRSEVDGERLTDGELVIQAIGLMVAGFETTIGLIGNGIRTLLEHPAQLALLRQRPDLLNNAIEECLRYDTPILFNWRVLVEPYTIGEVTMPADAVVWQMLGAANHDPRKFENPDEFLIDRAGIRHVSFGGGSHFCLGNHLAKLEARYAIGEFVLRTAAVRIEVGERCWSDSFFRVLGNYHLTFS